MGKKRKARYGSGSIVQRGKTFSIKWRENDKQIMRGGFPSRELAEQALASHMSGQATKQRNGVLDQSKVPTLSELAANWIKARLDDGLHRSARDDKNRWHSYWENQVGHLKPDQVDVTVITRAIKHLLADRKLAPATVTNSVRLLSTFYSDLVEDGFATTNPVRMLPKKTRKLIRPTVGDEPFIEKLEDVVHLLHALKDIDTQVYVAYGIGALAGLRTGEIIGLEWSDFHFERQVLNVCRQVRHGKVGKLKDGDERDVGLQDELVPIVTMWKLESGGEGQLFGRVLRGGRSSASGTQFIKPERLMTGLHEAMKRLIAAKVCPASAFRYRDAKGEEMYLTWYQATRHTFASQYMMAGGNLSKLQAELGHSDIQTTQRYAKMAPDFRTEKDRALLRLPKVPAKGKVLELRPGIGSKLVATAVQKGATNRSKKLKSL